MRPYNDLFKVECYVDAVFGDKKNPSCYQEGDFKINNSELGGIRTPNLLGRNQVHYPVVLRVLVFALLRAVKKGLQK